MRSWSVLLLLPMAAHAAVPLEVYPECGEPDRPDLCPSDLGEDWSYISYIPATARATILPSLEPLGSGMHIDLAWRQTVGTWEATIAVADSGISWDERDLVNKVLLNTGELPLPQDETGTEAADYDLDGNGLVNIQDYAADPRVSWDAGRDYADGLLDPSDLIYTFSDGVDDDGNGFVDDIAGWDFFDRDNDPSHEIFGNYGGHGTGVAEEAAAEGENGGHVGVCPNCSVLPVRVGDTFVTDGTRVGEAIAYATDREAVSVTLAIGAMSNPAETTEAARYAFEMGTTLVGAAGDENSYHHNFPAVLDDIIYTHSISHNTSNDEGKVKSYFNTWNCNNYGARMHTVAPSGACATGAVAATAGMVGLLQSAAWDSGTTLHPGEVAQLLQGFADDIALTDAETAETRAYPSAPGWDPFYGYGRVNAAKSVQAVLDGRIPPWLSIRSPGWFQVINEAGLSEVVIEGIISGERTTSMSLKVEVGSGFDPQTWELVEERDESGVVEGELTRIPTSLLAIVAVPGPGDEEGILERLARVNGPAVTVRIQVVDAEGNRAEQRKTFFVDPPNDQLPGFPVSLGASGESSPIMADLDGDGVFEVVVGLADGRVLALDGTGATLPGWPVRTELLPYGHPEALAHLEGGLPLFHDGILGTVAVGDLDDDGSPEVVAGAVGGGLYAWHADGSLVEGFPVFAIGRGPDEVSQDTSWDQGFMGAPSLSDLDGDGTLEIVAAGTDSRLYVVDYTGADWGPYPQTVCHPELCGTHGSRIINSVVIGDADGDGDLDFALGTNEALDDKYSLSYIFDATTFELLPGWPLEQAGIVNEAVLLPLIGEGHPASMAAVDIDGDGDLEYSNPVMLGWLGGADLFSHEAESALEIPVNMDKYGEGSNATDVPSTVQFINQPAFGDLDLDGVPDYVMGGVSTLYVATLAMREHMDFQNAIGAWNGTTGEYFPGWPRQIEDAQFLLSPAIADVDGDGYPEVIHGSAGYMLHAWNKDGVEPEGWPKFTGGWQLGSPAVGDIDGDGYLDVVVTTREGQLFAWTTQGHADQDVQWASIHHDAWNTSNHGTPLPKQAGPPPVAAPELKGCTGCARGSSAALVLPLMLLGWRRRRS